MTQALPLSPARSLPPRPKTPALEGPALQATTWLLESPVGSPLAAYIFHLVDMARFRRSRPDAEPSYLPELPRATNPATRPTPEALAQRVNAWAEALQRAGGLSHALAYTQGYRNGQWTPLDAVDAFLAAWARSEQEPPALRAFIQVHADDAREQARRSSERWARGEPLSVLDGVLVAIKDETPVQGYATTWGIRARAHAVAPRDAEVVARLRALGAIIVGKTNMHEGGIGVTGHNMHYGTARNPYAPKYYPGGSSSGSAVATVAGLVPFALGADAGGSIRVPAALSGGVGLKPTFGRVPAAYESLAWSIGHVGPMAALPGDVALLWAAIAGPGADAASQHQPELTMPTWRERLDGLTLGVDEGWAQQATPEIQAAFTALVAQLQAQGARVRNIILPDVAEAFLAHLVIAGVELTSSLRRLARADLGWEVRNTTALARYFTGLDYIHALRWRRRWSAHVEAALQEVDVLLLPATVRPSTPIPEQEVVDLGLMTDLMYYVSVFNLSGHPAITFPIGYTEDGRPLAAQAVGRYWDEATLLRLAWVAQQMVPRRSPLRDYRALAMGEMNVG
ncbi:MAG: amidase [Chloroflexi bacterium]|nr:amidase [Chloroflexota bacterium]